MALRTLPQAEEFNFFKTVLQKEMYMKSGSYYIDLFVHNEHFSVFSSNMAVTLLEVTYLHIR